MSSTPSYNARRQRSHKEDNGVVSHIAVLGLGNFGTAITRLWGDAGHHIQAWTATQEVFDSIRNKGTNEKYLPGIPLQAVVTMDLGQAVSGADIVVLALPTSVVWNWSTTLFHFSKASRSFSTSPKGWTGRLAGVQIHQDKAERRRAKQPLCVLTGPTITVELAMVYSQRLQ